MANLKLSAVRGWAFGVAGFVALAGVGMGMGAGVAAGEPPKFAAVVREHFSAWDADGNGKLTPDEIDRLTVDPAWKGADAAAIATIKLAMRAKTSPIESLALSEVDGSAEKPLSADPEIDQPVVEEGKKPATLQSRYARAERTIRTAKRELFIDPTPDLDKLHQGRLGDCFFVSMVGAMVERDSASVKGMISAKGEPTAAYAVAFGNGKAVEVPALTDAEYALVSTTGDEGMWLAVLEKAFGTLRMESRPKEKRLMSATDAIARGGSMSTSIQYLTGHKTERIGMRPAKNAKAKNDPEGFRTMLKEKLVAAVAAKRLIGAGTDDKPGVPGLSPNHAYAVMGFDEATQTLHIWNPHGNTFKPKGEAGKEQGYPTKAGRFDMPLADFAAVFRDVVIETEKPLTPPKSEDKR